MDFRRYYSPFILPGTAIFALLWAVARACVQSITIDEADTYSYGWPGATLALAGGIQQSRAEFAVDAPLYLGLRSEPFLRAGPGATRRGHLYCRRLPALPEVDAGRSGAMAGLRLPGL